MILYTLRNKSFTMDIYEDKVIFNPSWVTALLRKEWSSPLILPYSQLTRVDLETKLWPQGHRLSFYTADRQVTYTFRKLLPFFTRLQLYLAGQVARHQPYPQGRPLAMKTVNDILNERRDRLAA